MDDCRLSESYRTLPGRLRQMLTAQGFSQKRFSELTGISYESIGAYLRGYRVPSMPKFLLMVEYLPGVDVTWLLTGQTQAELE